MSEHLFEDELEERVDVVGRSEGVDADQPGEGEPVTPEPDAEPDVPEET